ncbi:MAG: hypothetical protein ACTHQM_23190 [Thermoanaerobaculia bacterium]
MKIARILAALISLTGIAIVVGVERSLRRSLHLLERNLVTQPVFAAIVVAAAALGFFFFVYGLACAVQNSASRIELFLWAETPLAVVSGGFVAFWLNTFRLVGDVGPNTPVEIASIPFPLVVFFRPVLFYAILAVLITAALIVFWRKNRPAA